MTNTILVNKIIEGDTEILVPRTEASTSVRPAVFFNPAMEENRSIGVCALDAYQTTTQRELSICDPLTGTGVRGIRYAKEVPKTRKVVINDANPLAVELAKRNVELNALQEIVIVHAEESNNLLSGFAARGQRLDVIDLDPFGSPASFIESAIRATKAGGLIAMTATDTGALNGVFPRACLRRYGSRPLRVEYGPEVGVRILAASLCGCAARHGFGIEVRLSHSTRHYLRIYATTEKGLKSADESVSKLGYLQHCFNCSHREVGFNHIPESQRCPNCGATLSAGGPIWLGKIFDKRFCQKTMENLRKKSWKSRLRVSQILDAILAEADGPPTYFEADQLAERLRLPSRSVNRIIESLCNMGYFASRTHFSQKGFRTDAPIGVLEETMTCLAR